jgi:hypothetical protein
MIPDTEKSVTRDITRSVFSLFTQTSMCRIRRMVPVTSPMRHGDRPPAPQTSYNRLSVLVNA